MSFTFDPSLADDVSMVRFHIGDTIDQDHRVEDATIKYYVDANGAGMAVIRCIQYIITRLSQPDERIGSYSISNASARSSYKELLEMKAQEFGISLSGVNSRLIRFQSLAGG